MNDVCFASNIDYFVWILMLIVMISLQFKTAISCEKLVSLMSDEIEKELYQFQLQASDIFQCLTGIGIDFDDEEIASQVFHFSIEMKSSMKRFFLLRQIEATILNIRVCPIAFHANGLVTVNGMTLLQVSYSNAS